MAQFLQEILALTPSEVLQLILIAICYFFVFLCKRYVNTNGTALKLSMKNVLNTVNEGRNELNSAHNELRQITEEKSKELEVLYNKVERLEKALRILVEVTTKTEEGSAEHAENTEGT